jgi:hypothetical protein
MDRGRLLSLRIISESLLCAEGIICAYMIPSYGGNIIWMERKFSIEGGPRCFLVVGVVVRQRGLLRRWGSKVRKMVVSGLLRRWGSKVRKMVVSKLLRRWGSKVRKMSGRAIVKIEGL